MTTPKPATVGTRVGVNHPKYPGVWVVKKVGPVNVVVEPENGGRPLRCPPTLLTDPPVPGAVPGSMVQTLPVQTMYHVGEVVRIPAGKYAGVYVVIADRGADKVNIAKLGGDGGAYLRALRGSISKIDVAELKGLI